MRKKNLPLPQGVEEIDPIFVIAPSTRNGTTLLQRLINSCPDAVLFGEDTVIMKGIPFILNVIKDRIYLKEQRTIEIQEHFKKEKLDFDSNNLLPRGIGMWGASVVWVINVLEHCRREARKLGARSWGFKYPLSTYKTLQEYFPLLPSARYVFIYRNLYDVIRSAKARKWLKSEDDIIDLASKWKGNMLWAQKLKMENFVLLQYEELIADPDASICKLESFLGIDGIDRDVMKEKVNTWKGKEQDGHSPTGYISPLELTERECELVKETASQALETLGYDFVPLGNV